MDPFYETLLIGAVTLSVVGGVGAWLMPKFDRAAGRLSDWMEDRKDRRAAR